MKQRKEHKTANKNKNNRKEGKEKKSKDKKMQDSKSNVFLESLRAWVSLNVKDNAFAKSPENRGG